MLLFSGFHKLKGGWLLYWLTLLLRAAATCYSYGWDIYMDWGLLRADNGLRSQLLYSPLFYYTASVIDLVLRCTWLISVIWPSSSYPYIASFEFATILAVAELSRRWIWSLIRIENEQVSNLERYRNILAVPELGAQEA